MAATFEESKLNSIDSALNTAPQLLEDSLAVAMPQKLSITGFTSIAATNTNLLDSSGGGAPTDVTNYQSAVLYIVSTVTTGSYIVQSAFDSGFAIGNGKNVQMQELDAPSTNPIGNAITPTNTTRAFNLNLQNINYIRVNLTTATAGVTAYLVLSQIPYTSTYTNVQQAIASSLNVTATAVLNGGTLTAIGIFFSTTDVSSGAITTTTSSSSIVPSSGISYSVVVGVTAVSGTNPSLQIDVQESQDGGGSWFTVYSFAPITAAGSYYAPKLPYYGSRIRYVQTVTGTSPSFTRAISRNNYNDIPSVPAVTKKLGSISAPTADLQVWGRVLSIACNNQTTSVIYVQIFNKSSALATNDIPVDIFPVAVGSASVIGVEFFGTYGKFLGSNARIGLSSTPFAYTAIASLTNTSLIIDYH
jgi:hypothetical protein